MKAAEARRSFSRAKAFTRGEQGSLLVESAMTFPVLILFTLMLMGLVYAAYSKAELIQHTFLWTERAAYVWKDTHREAVTGAFTYQEMDHVYGTLAGDGISLLTASLHSFRTAQVALPGGATEGSGLSGSKLKRSASALAAQAEGSAASYNRLFEREIRTVLNRAGPSDPGRSLFRTDRIGSAGASAYPVDPVEFLRTVDLVRTFAGSIRSRFASPKELSDELADYLPGQEERPSIRSEKEAKAYLQKLVRGEPLKVETSYGIRQIDALDSDGIMHEAKYTVNKQDAVRQIEKDAELIRKGIVKGVVWHFFPLASTGRCDLPADLRRRLEASGILVVVHS